MEKVENVTVKPISLYDTPQINNNFIKCLLVQKGYLAVCGHHFSMPNSVKSI